jgi:hypothetical protein
MCNACHEQRNPGRAPDTTNFEFWMMNDDVCCDMCDKNKKK